ncbi:MAG: hypothetical protein CM15mP102_12190 [Flavobacteriales bacterium]|nr:MAG: hypothetical protein CM15mP102_12190 [Flavobacteriales bacterium]
MPHVEVRSRRVGVLLFKYQPHRPDRKISIAMKWLISSSRKRNEKSMAVKLAQEILLLQKKRELLSRKESILTKWLKQIRPFHTLDFNIQLCQEI